MVDVQKLTVLCAQVDTLKDVDKEVVWQAFKETACAGAQLPAELQSLVSSETPQVDKLIDWMNKATVRDLDIVSAITRRAMSTALNIPRIAPFNERSRTGLFNKLPSKLEKMAELKKHLSNLTQRDQESALAEAFVNTLHQFNKSLDTTLPYILKIDPNRTNHVTPFWRSYSVHSQRSRHMHIRHSFLAFDEKMQDRFVALFEKKRTAQCKNVARLTTEWVSEIESTISSKNIDEQRIHEYRIYCTLISKLNLILENQHGFKNRPTPANIPQTPAFISAKKATRFSPEEQMRIDAQVAADRGAKQRKAAKKVIDERIERTAKPSDKVSAAREFFKHRK